MLSLLRRLRRAAGFGRGAALPLGAEEGGAEGRLRRGGAAAGGGGEDGNLPQI